MCSTGGDDGANLLEPKPKLIENGAICRKCKTSKAHIVLQIKDAYCKDCFVALCNHKFRAVLGKSRIFGNEPKSVIIAFSGSASSLALLKLLADAVAAGPQHRRILALPKIVFIDEGALLNQSNDQRKQICSDILRVCQKYEFPVYFVPINTGNIRPSEIESYVMTKEVDSQVSELFNSLPDVSARLDLLTRIRSDVLANCARSLNASIVMLADTATSVAVKILSGIALGRGASISLETGFTDTRHSDVTFLRPLQDFTSKETSMFNIFNRNNELVFVPSFLTMTDSDISIQRLTEDFIVTLQNDFPSTVSTIYRTGEKFCAPESKTTCALCLGPMDTAPRSCSALEATEYSREVSTEKKQAGCGSCNCKKGESAKLMEALCYSCRLIARKMDNHQNLPSYVLDRARESVAFSEMRSQIEEFLIEDDE